MRKELDDLRRSEAFSALDVHFALFLCRLVGESSRELAFGAGMASKASTSGHTCVELSEYAGKPLTQAEIGHVGTAPLLEDWVTCLRSSRAVGRPGEFRPLILDDSGRLYLYRYWRYEMFAAQEIGHRAARLVPGTDDEVLRSGLERLFGADNIQEIDWQKIAAATAVLRHLCIISGGPGTGKTSAVGRILALLREQPGGERLNVALAAPTGKAAARLQESIRAVKDELPVDDRIKEAIPDQSSTIHRLLGARPDSIAFHHNADNPLPVDVLVVDEASMLDIALFARLLEALAPGARLIMIGDKDQLASVEPGAVLGDLCRFEAGYSTGFRDRLARITGSLLPERESGSGMLNDAVVTLRRNYRFSADSGIGELSGAARRGDVKSCLRLLEPGAPGEVELLEQGGSVWERVKKGYSRFLDSVVSGAPPGDVFRAFGEFRVLCVLRAGPRGVGGLNQAITRLFREEGHVDGAGTWWPGRPVIVTRNDHNLSLFNGDIGILLPDPACGGDLRVFFQMPDGRVRTFPPGRLPEHETVYAMTVHKSQGSEFDSVLLILPETDAAVLTRELVYTAVTRARERFSAYGDRGLIAQALTRRTDRVSGLYDALA